MEAALRVRRDAAPHEQRVGLRPRERAAALERAEEQPAAPREGGLVEAEGAIAAGRAGVDADASRSSIQRASSAGTKCSVPRIGQVRTIWGAAIAASTAAASTPASRNPVAQSPPR